MRFAPRAVVTLALLASVSCNRESRRSAETKHGESYAQRPFRMSPEGLARIRESEDFIARAYDDGVGNQTIGYGHMILAGETYAGGMTEPQARELFERDVSRIVNSALNQVQRPLTQNQVDALGSFIFNVGPGNFVRSVLPAL